MDFLLEDFGREIYILRAMTPQAQAWTAAHLGDLPTFAGGRLVEPHYIGYVRRTLPTFGFTATETSYRRAS
jgi:hypothetical protein